MKTRLFIMTALSTTLLLSACGKEETQPEADNSKAHHEKTKHHTTEESNKNEQNKEGQSAVQNNIESPSTADNTTETSQPLDYNNVTDRSTLENILYGHYTEMQKIAAYNSAVANGVIPQGNVMEGPALAAYKSSLRIESGEEKSIYEQMPSDDEALEDVNAEINAATTEDAYIQALRKKYHGGLSSGEIQMKHAIEEGYYDGDDADVVYEKILEEEQLIQDGAYKQYEE